MRTQKLGSSGLVLFVLCKSKVQVYLDSFLSIDPLPRLLQNSILKTIYLFVVLPILDSFLFTFFEYQVFTVPLSVLSHIINTSSRNSWSCCSHKRFMTLWFEMKMYSNRLFAAKPSCDLLFIKLWAATLRMLKMEKACRKHQNGQVWSPWH